MNQLQKMFNHPEFGKLQVITEGDKDLFNLSQVAFALGYTRPNANGVVYLRHDRIEKVLEKLDISTCDRGGHKYIDESGLYDFVFEAGTDRSRNYRKWVTSEVLPSIRKHGGYIATNDDDDEESIMARAVLIANKTIERKNKQITEQKKVIEKQRPKVLFADSVEASQTSILVRELAVILKQNGIDTGEKRLYEWLRSNGFLIKRFGSDRNTPTQRSMDMGLFEIKETTINHNSGLITVSKTTKVTGKGQVYFINKFLAEKEAI